MPEILFFKLEQSNKALALCELSEHYFQQGNRVLVMVQDDNQGVSLDRFLWTWNKGSFLPHAFDNGSVDCLNEPVVISTKQSNPNNASVLILGTPCEFDFLKRFDLVIDFAELYDSQEAERSRERFREYRAQGLAPQMM